MVNSTQLKNKIETVIQPVSNFLTCNRYSNEYFDRFYKELEIIVSVSPIPLEIERIKAGNLFLMDNEFIIPEEYIKVFIENVCNITLLPHSDGIELYRLEIYNQNKGTGTTFMKIFSLLSQKTNIPILVTPGDPGNKGKTDFNKLEKFYKRFGFKKISRSKYWINTYPNGKVRQMIFK
jgi:hypothetical protein